MSFIHALHIYLLCTVMEMSTTRAFIHMYACVCVVCVGVYVCVCWCLTVCPWSVRVQACAVGASPDSALLPHGVHKRAFLHYGHRHAGGNVSDLIMSDAALRAPLLLACLSARAANATALSDRPFVRSFVGCAMCPQLRQGVRPRRSRKCGLASTCTSI